MREIRIGEEILDMKKSIQQIIFKRGDYYSAQYLIGDKEIYGGDIIELYWPDGTKIKGKAKIDYTYCMRDGHVTDYDKYDLVFKTKLYDTNVEIVLCRARATDGHGNGYPIDVLNARFVKRPREKKVMVDTA